MLVNRENINTAFTGFNAAFTKGFSGIQPSYGKVAITVPSNSSSENLGWLGQFPKMREWLGDRVVNSLVAHAWTITNRRFENTVSVARTDFEDDKYGIFGPIFQEMGQGAAEYPDELIFKLLLDGFTTKCYDDQYFFDTGHPVTSGGAPISVANTDGGSGSPWFLLDTSRVVKPLVYQERIKPSLTALDADTDDNVFWKDEYVYGVRSRFNVSFGFWQLAWGSKQTLDAAHYEAARVGLAKMVGDENRPLGIRPTLLVVGPSLEGAARKLLTNELASGGESNEWKGTAELLVSPWLG